MALKKHHKIIIGSFSSLVIIFMILTSIFVYMIFIKQNVNYNLLNKKIINLQTDTQNQISILADNLMQTQELVEESQEALQLEMDLLKASAGEDFSGIIENSIKSVVIIKTNLGQGTGFIINSEGYIVTNYHVMENVVSAGIYTYDSELHQVNLIGYNSNLDIALLQIPGDYDSLKLTDSDDIQIGEKVIAIGNPLGLQFSVSGGIVSNIHQIGPTGIKAYIQTDAALNPGNSGGPLINKQGKVIGINNFKIKETEGMGFALESNYIKDAVNTISQQALNQTLIE